MQQHHHGIKAMEGLQKRNNNKNVLSDEMTMFIILNTASIQIIPTTIIALRASLQSNNPTEIIVPIWISTIVANIFGITITKIYLRIRRGKNVENN